MARHLYLNILTTNKLQNIKEIFINYFWLFLLTKFKELKKNDRHNTREKNFYR